VVGQVRRPDLGDRREASPVVLGGVGLEEDLAQLVADGQRRIRRGVGATGDAELDLAERDLVGHLDGRLDAGVAGLLDVGGRRLGREARAEHGLAGQVEVAAVLEHGAGDELTSTFAFESIPLHEAVEGRGQHVLVGHLRVDGVRASERDAVAADDGHRTHCAARCRGRVGHEGSSLFAGVSVWDDGGACAPHHTGGLVPSHEVTVSRHIQIPMVCER
jgi:hypothetical protein